MSVGYKGILWNRQKRIYDGVLLGLVLFYLVVFVWLSARFIPEITPETLITRATGTLAFFMLHVVLSIGPMARIDTRFLILLYNRRHLGVTLFGVSMIHGIFNLLQFHSLGNVNPFVSLFTSNTHYDSFINFPFQVLGFFALIILLLMAATSHDFWLANLTPRIWKALHMMVYLAYTLIVLHIALGVIQLEHDLTLFLIMMVGMFWLMGIHLLAAFRERKMDLIMQPLSPEGWVEVAGVNEIPDNRARIVFANGERIAVFRYGGKLAAVSNVCKHQNGPLGEGKIIDGCITCPWHGYQYKPEDGCSPPPFKEKVATFNLKLIGTKVYVNPNPNSEGVRAVPVYLHDYKSRNTIPDES